MKHNYNFQFVSSYRLEVNYSLTLADGRCTRISVRYGVPEYNDRDWSLSAEEFEREIAGELNIVRWTCGDNENPIPLEIFEAFVQWLKATKRYEQSTDELTRGRYDSQTGWIKI